VFSKTPQGMILSTEKFWNAWLNKKNFVRDVLTPEQKKLYDTSLFVLRAHADNQGAIIASSDSTMIEYGKDDYAYMWPRDAAFIASVLDQAGYTEVTKPFFHFCQEVLHPDGYLHHRYNCDKSLGSTWHSSLVQKDWLKDKILQLPIQEDETAGVLFALWQHYLHSKDIEMIENLYRPFIAKAADFLLHFRSQENGLPLYSYDLWEEKIGVSTYTCAAVYGGLQAAGRFSELLGKRDHMRDYITAAKEIKEATIKHLYSEKLQSFIRVVTVDGSTVKQEEIVDTSSLYGLWYYGMLDQNDPLFISTHKQVMARLYSDGPIGGFIRYEHDGYFKSTDKSNPWIITTLWEAQRRLSREDVNEEDIKYTREILDWVIKYMYPSGVLAEQLNPYTGENLSSTPLVWSHATYVETVLKYIQSLRKLGKIAIEPTEMGIV
jgi:GH15 family glucan-1,4-alpha-glucosidase